MIVNSDISEEPSLFFQRPSPTYESTVEFNQKNPSYLLKQVNSFSSSFAIMQRRTQLFFSADVTMSEFSTVTRSSDTLKTMRETIFRAESKNNGLIYDDIFNVTFISELDASEMAGKPGLSYLPTLFTEITFSGVHDVLCEYHIFFVA